MRSREPDVLRIIPWIFHKSKCGILQYVQLTFSFAICFHFRLYRSNLCEQYLANQRLPVL